MHDGEPGEREGGVCVCEHGGAECLRLFNFESLLLLVSLYNIIT